MPNNYAVMHPIFTYYEMNQLVDKVSRFLETIPPSVILLSLLIPLATSSAKLLIKKRNRLHQINMEFQEESTGGGRKNKNKKNRSQQNNQNNNVSADDIDSSKADSVNFAIPPPPQSPKSGLILEDEIIKTGVKDPMPLLGSREAERNLLIILNKRFEKIIEKNRQLQQANQQLTTQLNIQQLECNAKVTEVTAVANGKLDKTQEELTAAKKEIATLTSDLGTSKKVADDLKSRLEDAVNEIGMLKKQIGNLEGQVEQLNSKLKKELEQKQRTERELKEWKNQAIKEGETLQEAKAQLEKETFLRLDLEQELNGKLNESSMKATIIETEMVQLKAYTTNMLNDQNEQQQKEFESKLESNLRSLRDEYERKLLENKNEQSKLYGMKEADHIAKKESLAEDLKDKDNQLKAAQLKMTNLTENVRKLEGERHGLIVQLDDLEKEKIVERQKLEKEIANRDKMLEVKVTEKNELVSQCQHLLDVKVALDNELATYRLLLETEESRLELSDLGKRDENQNFV